MCCIITVHASFYCIPVSPGCRQIPQSSSEKSVRNNKKKPQKPP